MPGHEEQFSLVYLEQAIWLVTREIGVPVYDYEFERHFACQHPWRIPEDGITAIARLGAAEDYEARYNHFATLGIHLIHTPSQYLLSSELPQWYPKLETVTPTSAWYDSPPTAEEIGDRFGWPVFVKGQRQTNRHNRKLSIIETPEQYAELCDYWQNDAILAWQQMVCREFIPLRPVVADTGNTMPKSYEFRCFCWQGQVVGLGNYWFSESYAPTPSEEIEIRALAETAAKALALPFLVVDVAQTADGRWIIIECNDGQDSGYAGINPMAMWSKLIDSDPRP